ncbi:MAG: DNA-processing protein DprA [Gammaproteobacteria bacterium]|nr:DNA-processing protein DprA [Gammaproteobacteria bacterium]
MDDPSTAPQVNPEAWLLVSQARGIGSRTFLKLLTHFGDPETILSASTTQLEATGLTRGSIEALRQADPKTIQPSLEWLNQAEHDLLTLNHPCYPTLLAEIYDPPPVLFVHGDPQLLNQPQLAIVGSRNPTPSGIDNAREFARCLAAAGLMITSGLAIGIDGAAHEGALLQGSTIAVTGTGLDRVYPARHKALAHRIVQHGLLVSEFPPGTQAKPENFPRRNRIISGLSVGTLVVEATQRSGSLITARLALEQGREVFAIPGSIHNPQARGCHRLIREGAKLVESVNDISEELSSLLGGLAVASNPGPSDKLQKNPTGLKADHAALLEAMGFDPISVDDMIGRTGLTADVVSSMLLLLELEGHVSSVPGGYYCRTGKI